MAQEDNQPPQVRKPIHHVTLVPIVDQKITRKKEASSGKNTMIIGGVICGLGLLLTLLSGFQTLFWGAISLGGIAFIAGLVQYNKSRSGISK
jgi:hypothetical protein